MTPTLRSQPAQFSTQIVHWPLMFHALLSLCFGACIYVLLRQHLPIFIPDWFADIHFQFAYLIPATLTQSLPSFFHMYALMLASHALYLMPAPATTHYFHRIFDVPFIVCFTIGFGLELVQHPVFTPWLLRLSLAYSDTAPLLWSATDYGVRGTYDLNDMLAIIIAGIVATLHAQWLSKKINKVKNTVPMSYKQPILNGDN